MNIPMIINNPSVNAILQWIIVLGVVASVVEPYATKWPNVYDFLSRLAGLGGDLRKVVGGGTGSSGRAAVVAMSNEDEQHPAVVEAAAKIVTNNLEVPPPPKTPTPPAPKAPAIITGILLMSMTIFALSSTSSCAAWRTLPPADQTLIEIDAEKLACAMAQTGLDALGQDEAAIFLEGVCGLTEAQAKAFASARKMSMSIAPAAHPSKSDAGAK